MSAQSHTPAPEDVSDEAVGIAPDDAADHDAAAPPIGPVEPPVADAARQSVVRDWLQDRFDALLITGCAYAVRGLAIGVAGVKFVQERALFGLGENIANRLGLKAVDASLFFLQVSQGILKRKLLHLQAEKAIQEIGGETLRALVVAAGFVDKSLDVFRNLRSALREANGAGGNADEGRNVL